MGWTDRNLFFGTRNKYLTKTIISVIIMVIFFLFLDDSILYELMNLWVHYQFKLKALIYAFVFLLSCFAIILGIVAVNRRVYLFILSLSAIGIFINQTYRSLNGSGINYEEVLIVFQNIGFGLGGQIVYTFFPFMLKALIYPLVFIILGFIIRYVHGTFSSNSNFSILLFVVSVTMAYAIMDYSNGVRTSLPSPVKVPALAIYTLSSPLYYGPKEEVKENIVHQRKFDHIIWIVDESVRGDQLSVNNTSLNTTPFLDSIEANIYSLGVASSGSVCSDYSHIIMMSGVQPHQLPDKTNYIRKSPTIFQYALKAGYHTNLIYSPGYEDEPHGFLTEYDFQFIENRHHTKMLNPAMPHYNFDFKSLEELEKIIGNQERSFTYFLKYGCHFHYETAYPPERKYFQPTQQVSDWKREDRQILLNSYYNALRWTVDEFFRSLMNTLSEYTGKKILIIYTSDHGQNLLEYPEIKMTHCMKENAPSVMAMVPMILMSPEPDNLSQHIPAINNRQSSPSHFQVFPSTLQWMGYDSSFINKKYGPTFFSEHQDSSRIFMSGDIFGRSKSFMNSFHSE